MIRISPFLDIVQVFCYLFQRVYYSLFTRVDYSLIQISKTATWQQLPENESAYGGAGKCELRGLNLGGLDAFFADMRTPKY